MEATKLLGIRDSILHPNVNRPVVIQLQAARTLSLWLVAAFLFPRLLIVVFAKLVIDSQKVGAFLFKINESKRSPLNSRFSACAVPARCWHKIKIIISGYRPKHTIKPLNQLKSWRILNYIHNPSYSLSFRTCRSVTSETAKWAVPESIGRFYLNKDWGCVILREIDFLLKICWPIPCLHPSWRVLTWKHWYFQIWWIAGDYNKSLPKLLSAATTQHRPGIQNKISANACTEQL